MTDYGSLAPGQELPAASYVLEREAIAAYIEAVEDAAASLAPRVPPMAIAAYALRAIMAELQLPAGSVHLSQELEFHQVVAIGEEITCKANIARNSVRGEWRFVTVEMAASAGVATVMTGRAGVMLPVGG